MLPCMKSGFVLSDRDHRLQESPKIDRMPKTWIVLLDSSHRLRKILAVNEKYFQCPQAGRLRRDYDLDVSNPNPILHGFHHKGNASS
jgi:hypothetical protein